MAMAPADFEPNLEGLEDIQEMLRDVGTTWPEYLLNGWQRPNSTGAFKMAVYLLHASNSSVFQNRNIMLMTTTLYGF
jgi:hypothetical protein